MSSNKAAHIKLAGMGEMVRDDQSQQVFIFTICTLDRRLMSKRWLWLS